MTTLTKKIPYVKQMAIQMEAYKMLICSRVGWTEQDYETYRFESAMEFIDDMIDCLHPEDKKLITYSSFFWGWFKNKWYALDLKLYNEPSLTIADYCGILDYELRTDTIIHRSFYSNFEAIVDDGFKRLKEEMERANKV